MCDIVRFTNGYLALPDGTAAEADLYIDAATGLIISDESECLQSGGFSGRVIDLGGNLLAPGLIDAQINGAYGVDFSELDMSTSDGGEARYVQKLEEVARRIVETGCTSFVPTIMSLKEELYAKLLRLLAPRSTPGSAHALGYHAEGPFLHPRRRGAHAEALLRDAAGGPSVEVLESVYGKDGLDQSGVKLITVAPDVEGVMQCIPELVRRGVIVSIGHSDASLEVASEAVRQGASMITHLFNAMPPIHHRDPGIIGLLGSPDQTRPYFGLIVDGHHIHPNTVRIAYRAAPDRCVLVTDAQLLMDPHLPDGVYGWRPGIPCRKEGHAVYLDGTSTLAGSCAPLDQCVRNLCAFTGASLPEALLAATRNPALALGGEMAKTKGQLKEGFHADLCVLDREGNAISTWIMGREVWRDGRRGQVGSAEALGTQGRDRGRGSKWSLDRTSLTA